MTKSKEKKVFPVGIAYAFGMLSYNMEYTIIAQLNYALTDSYSFSAISAGMIFLISRFFDGFTDIVAGYIIDRFNPRCGKSRVYDLLHLPMWILLVLTFSVPDIGTVGKFIWVFVFYNMLQSVTTTFMNVAEPLRLQRSVTSDKHMSVMRTTSFLTLIVGYAGGIALPSLISYFENMPHGWTIITMIFAVPFTIIGLLRFFLLPELADVTEQSKSQERPSLAQCIKALFSNRYSLIFGGVMICWAMYNTINSSASTYYFTHVYGNLSAASLIALPGMLSIIFVLFIPKLVEKFGKENCVRIGLCTSAAACLLKLLFPYNLVGLGLLSLAATCGIMTLSFMKQLLNIDCITYGKLKNKNPVEAAYSTVNSVADKVGLGLGSLTLGLILQIGGYDGTATVQSASAITTIRALYTVVPAALMIIAIIFFAFYHAERDIKKLQGAD